MRTAITDASRPMLENNAIATSGLLSDLSNEPVDAEIGTKTRAAFGIQASPMHTWFKIPSLRNSRRSCDEGSTHSVNSAKYLHQMTEPDNATEGTIRQITLPGCNDFGWNLRLSAIDRRARRRTRRAAIDEDLRALNVRSIVGSEEQHRLGDFIGFAEPPERNGAGNSLVQNSECFGSGSRTAPDRRPRGAGRNHIDANAARREFRCHHPGHRPHPGLARRIG